MLKNLSSFLNFILQKKYICICYKIIFCLFQRRKVEILFLKRFIVFLQNSLLFHRKWFIISLLASIDIRYLKNRLICWVFYFSVLVDIYHLLVEILFVMYTFFLKLQNQYPGYVGIISNCNQLKWIVLWWKELKGHYYWHV